MPIGERPPNPDNFRVQPPSETDPLIDSAFPRWLHVWAIATVVIAAILLGFGESVTTLRAGMADPDWPTRPWHLALESKDKWTAGFLVEHTHRILGFLVGGLMSVLAIGAWACESRKGPRWAAIASLVVLLGAFGWFHGQMMAQVNSPTLVMPWPSTIATLCGLVGLFGICFAAGQRPTPGTGARVLVSVALFAVMIQGLLGGLRVRLDQLVGVELSFVHGTFATLVFALLFAIPVLTSRGPTQLLPQAASRKLNWQTTALVSFTLMQIAWGAWVRHAPDRMSSRLHLLFAFIVVGLATLAIKQALADPATKERLKWPARVLMALITLQLLFGVEAWLGKFMTGEPLEARPIPPVGQAIVRTVHAHIGAWILAVGAWFAIAARRKPIVVGPVEQAFVDYEDRFEPRGYAASGVGNP